MSTGPTSKLVVVATLMGLAIALFLRDLAAKKVERVSLPGFSIELPAGKVTETSDVPSGGSHKIDLESSTYRWLLRQEAGSPKIAVQWMSQGGTREEWRENFLPIFTSALGSTVGAHPTILKEQSIDDQRWLYIVGDSKWPIGLGVVSCDDDFQVMVIYGRYRDTGRQSEVLGGILSSVECAASREQRTRLTTATRLPAKFGRTSDDDYEGFKSLDGEILITTFTNGDVQRDRKAYMVIAKSLLSTSFGADIRESQIRYLADPALERPATLLRYDGPTAERATYISTQYCAEHKQSLMIVWFTPTPDDDLARERAGQLGCPGDESREVARFSELAAEACSGGDPAACDASDSID